MAFTNFNNPFPTEGAKPVTVKTVEMVMDRNYTVRSTLGHIITFKKGEPTLVVASMVRSCAEVGARRVDGEEAIKPVEEEDVAQAQQAVDPGQRMDDVRAAIDKLVEKNDVDDFTAGGSPKVASVSEVVGYKIDRTEVARAWKQRNEELAENDAE